MTDKPSQNVDPSVRADPSHVEIGVTWGRGLLEEEIEETGALALVLTALARELERPVDLGQGRRGGVEVEILLGADVCSLRSRGTVETLRAAWSRLPLLFDRPLIAEGLRPRDVPAPRWTADVLARTGATAFALQGRGAVAQGAHAAARRLLRELDPREGTIGCVVWTDDPSLRGLVSPSAPSRRPALTPRTWASGEPRWRPGRTPGAEDGDRPLMIAPGRTKELASVMLPRTAEGHAAAELLRNALAEGLVAADDEWNIIHLHSQGMGEGLRTVLSTTTPVQPEKRPLVLEELLRRMGQLSTSWIESGIATSSAPAWLERGRRARGMGPEPEPSVAGIRRALEGAERSIHLALDPAHLDFAKHRRLMEIPEISPAEPDPEEPERVFPVSRRGRRGGDSDPSTRIRLARSTLALEDSTTGPEADVVRFDDLVAVLTSERGTRCLIDRAGTALTVRTRDLVEGTQLDRYLTHVLRRVPHLSFEESRPRTGPGAGTPRRTRWFPVAVGAVLMMVLVALVLLAVADPEGGSDPEQDGLAVPTPGTEDAWSWENLRWGETVDLSNGTLITVSRPDPQPVSEEGQVRDYRVDVTFCGGAASEGLRMDDETARPIDQNLVRSADFVMYNDSGGLMPPPEGPSRPEDLQPTTLEEGECTSGALWFTGQAGEDPSVAYSSAVGDRVTWSREG